MTEEKKEWPKLKKEDRVESLDELAERLIRNKDDAPDLIGQQKPSKVLAQSREFLHGVMDYYWNEARTNGWDPANELTQDKIFAYFLDFMQTKINDNTLEPDEEGMARERFLKDAMHTWIGNRDSTLIKYTNDLNKAILNIHPKLTTKRYLIIKAKTSITGKLRERIVSVDSYQNEQSIDQLLTEQKEKYLPKIENGDIEGLEVLSVSNAIAYFEGAALSDKAVLESKNKSRRAKNIKDSAKELDYREDFRDAQYLILARNKRGPREEQKFVDWESGLKLLDEFPYDGIGVTIVTPNEKEMYIMRAIAKKITVGSTEKRKQNRYYEHNNNLPARYSKGEFRKILNEMNRVETEVRNKMKLDPSYIPIPEEYVVLARGFGDKQVIDNQRIETQILTKYLSGLRDEPQSPLYHSGSYIARRKKDREAKIANPAMTVSRDDKYKIRENKIPKSKPKIDKIVQNLEEFWSDVFA